MLEQRSKNNNFGFTLVETLVAITILLVGVLGPLTLVTRGISDGLFARNQITANYLAQEALETVLNKRMTNSFTHQLIWNEISVCFDKTCRVILPEGSLEVANCSAGESSECRLVYDKNSGVFKPPDQSGVDPVGPVFDRRVVIEPPGSTGEPTDPDEIKVKVTVTWYNFGLQKELTLAENLYRY